MKVCCGQAIDSVRSAGATRSGNTLLVVLFFCVVMGIVLASVLKLISARYTTTVRSNDWNQTIPVLEAGIEEAMTHLHDDSNDYSANGWSPTLLGGYSVYTKQRSFSDGSFFQATIYLTNANGYCPYIYSSGFVRSPLAGSQYISRLVRVGTTNPPNLFTKAITTSGTITLNGNITSVDGYDSRIGPYNTATNRNGTGSLASDSTNRPAISIGSASVYGAVDTGPGGTVSVNGSGSIGDTSWSTNHSGIESGFTNDNMNVSFPTNAPPTGTPTAWPALTTNATVLTGPSTGPPTYYQTSSYSGNAMIVTGNVILYVPGSVSITSHGYIQIMPGGSLTMIVGGPVSIAGGGVINGTGLASMFSLEGTTGCTSISYTGGAAFVGTINAPQADVTLNGGADIYGAVVAKSATVSGGTGFHYDDALAAMSGLVATSWTEL